MNYNISEDNWSNIGKKSEFYIREYPKILADTVRTLQNISPTLTKSELYKIIIKSHAQFIDIPYSEIDDYVEDVLKQTGIIAMSQNIPFSLRVVVLHLIGQLFTGTIQDSILETIPEDL